jgi:outer membrane protein
MDLSARLRGTALALLVLAAGTAMETRADPQALEQARALLAQGNAAGAFAVLAPLEARLAGQADYDYLLGVAALDSGRLEDAIIAFERVLAVNPNHAGAQMDLARGYYAAGSFDLAEAAFVKLRAANPPATAQAAIERYLDAIRERRQQTRAGWTSFGELGLGYDSNITGVPTDFGAAALQAFNLSGIDPTGNSIKRKAGFAQGAVGGEYSRPLSRGWSAFVGGDLRGRVYRSESNFDSYAGEVHAGAALNDGPNQWRTAASLMGYRQEGEAPGDPKPTNDRNMGGLALDWRHAIDTRTQLGLGMQLNAVRFPKNEIEDFDQLYLSAAWLKSFERTGLPLFYATAFVTEDRARNKFADGVTDKSKNLLGVRTYAQYSLGPKLQLFNALGLVTRRDKDAFARSTQVEKGRDTYGEAAFGVAWQFRDGCNLRAQYAFSGNRSNIDIYDFNRHEISSVIRCEMN